MASCKFREVRGSSLADSASRLRHALGQHLKANDSVAASHVVGGYQGGHRFCGAIIWLSQHSSQVRFLAGQKILHNVRFHDHLPDNMSPFGRVACDSLPGIALVFLHDIGRPSTLYSAKWPIC